MPKVRTGEKPSVKAFGFCRFSAQLSVEKRCKQTTNKTMDIFDLTGEDESPFATPEVETSVDDSNTDVITDPPTELETEQGETEIEASTTEEEAPETETEAEPTEEEAEKTEEDVEAEVEARLADPKSPKWFKNAVENVYKPKISALTDELETVKQFGTTEEVTAKLGMLAKLDTVRSNPQTGMPERSTEDFVKELYEKDSQTAYQLLNDLATLPSPNTQGYTVLQEMFKQVGIDPTRLEEVKAFAANGYQLQAGQYEAPDPDDLAQIPEHLRDTFSRLSPDRRASLMYDPDNVRNEALEEAKFARDMKAREEMAAQTKEQREASEKAQQEAQFKQTVDTKAFEHFSKTGETVFTSFVESLAKQASMSSMDSLMIANTVLNSFEPTLAGKQSLEMLKAEGIDVDPQIATTINSLEENARHIAYYEAINDRPSLEKSVAKQVELQERLLAKGNKIIASLALKKANGTAQKVTTQNSKLAPTQTTRYATAGVGSTVNSDVKPPDNFSDEGYAELLRATGWTGNRR